MFLQKYGKIISLGSNCCVKMWLSENKILQETSLFDYIGSSMWSIQLALNANFADFVEKKQLINMEILSKGEGFIVTHKEYYFRFKHDFKHNYEKYTDPSRIIDKNYSDFVDKYTRRIDRFYKLITQSVGTKERIIFVRLEENDTDRIEHTKYEKYKMKSELEYLREISTYIQKLNNKLDFGIIFISFSEPVTSYEKDTNILVIHVERSVYDNIKWFNCKDEMTKIFDKHKRLLISIF